MDTKNNEIRSILVIFFTRKATRSNHVICGECITMYWDIMTPYYDYVVGNNHMNMFKRGRIFSAKSIFLFIELKSFVELPTL